MNAAHKESTDRKPGSAEARSRAVAAVGAWACIGVATRPTR
jgi:hypothetical protein